MDGVNILRKASKWIRIRDWIVIPWVGSAVIAFFYCDDCALSGNWSDFMQTWIISGIFWTALGNGNGVIVDVLDKKVPWIDHPIKRFLWSVLTTLVYTVIMAMIIIYGYVELYFGADIEKVVNDAGWWQLLRFPIGITFAISIFLHGRGFLLEWRQAALNVEKLKTENLSSKYESLKNQVNPHFLFNSLNALSSLIYADQDKAAHFVQKLSEVYRYVLEHQYEEVVDLSNELEFVKSFVYLNKIRFGDNLQVNFEEIDDAKGQFSLPPLTLQMLVENSIKHNEISKEFPLQIDIKKVGEMLCVTNNLNPLSSPKRDSNGLGLSNIISRYEYLSAHKVEVESRENQFAVSVPLLNLNES